MDFQILPFEFKVINGNQVLLTSDAGDFHCISLKEFDDLLAYRLEKNSETYQDLKSKFFLADSNISNTIDLLSIKYRSKKSFLKDFTSLHMMVITLRCNHECKYCQVTSEIAESYKYDMLESTAEKVVEKIFLTPSNNIKIEFQGGEPLLNWKAIVVAVKKAEKLNEKYKKRLEFVICTNLSLLSIEMIEFINKHDISISTSLDGDKLLHDKNRILRGGGSSYDAFINKLQFARDNLNHRRIGPLMTATIDNIDKFKEIVDQYISLGFEGIFFRALNPYGSADKNKEFLGYPIKRFLDNYEKALNYIIDLNLNGVRFVEYYATLLLTRILTPFGTGFVDLQSPSGAGISGVIYDYNGDVYPADEARMLSRMGDKKFLMGNVYENDYFEIFNSDILNEIVQNSCLEIIPACSHCVYRPYCGADPVRNYLESKDLINNNPNNDFCLKNKGIFDLLFKKILKNDRDEMNVFWSWITNRSFVETSASRKS